MFRPFVTPQTVACQAPLCMEFSRQEYWSELSFPTPGNLPDSGIEPSSLASPALAGRFLTTAPPEIWLSPINFILTGHHDNPLGPQILISTQILCLTIFEMPESFSFLSLCLQEIYSVGSSGERLGRIIIIYSCCGVLGSFLMRIPSWSEKCLRCINWARHCDLFSWIAAFHLLIIHSFIYFWLYKLSSFLIGCPSVFPIRYTVFC